MQQIAVGRVQLNQIEASVTGIADRLTEIVDDPRDLFGFQGTRHRGVGANSMAVFIAQGGASTGAQRGRRYWRAAARLQAAMGNTPGVPQLDGDTAIFRMNTGGDFLPGGNLLRAVQARRAGIAFGLGRNLRRFGDDQAGAGALAVVFAHQRGRDIARLDAAQTRQRRHKYAIRDGDRTDFQWAE